MAIVITSHRSSPMTPPLPTLRFVVILSGASALERFEGPPVRRNERWLSFGCTGCPSGASRLRMTISSERFQGACILKRLPRHQRHPPFPGAVPARCGMHPTGRRNARRGPHLGLQLY